MKRSYLFKNIGGVCLAVGLLVSTCLTSCKDNSPGTIDFSKSPALLAWQYTGFQATPYVASVLPLASQKYSAVEVTLSVASLTLSSTVTANIVSDPTSAANFIATDTAGGKKDHVMPTSLYTMPTSVTIKPGQQTVVVPIVFAGDQIDFTQNYIIAVKLADASGAQLTSNLNNALIEVVLKNIYAGTYEASGTRHHPTLGNFTFDYDVAMTTVNKTTIDGPALADLDADLQLVVNPDNTVVVTSPGGGGQPTTMDSPGLVNSYNPATKTFTLHYQYNTSAPRTITETLVYVGP